MLGVLFASASCKKDDTSVGSVQKSCTLNKIIYWNGMMPVDVKTDSLGNITKYGAFDLVKSGDSLLFKIPGSMDATWYILYDNLKRPIKYESNEGLSYTLTYNNSKEMPSKIVYKGALDTVGLTLLPTYTGSNISQIKYIANGQELNLVVDYFYNKSNVLATKLKILVPGWKLDAQMPWSFAMMFSANLVKSITLPQTQEGMNYSYQFDANNNIIQEKLLFGATDSSITQYGYQCK